VVLIYEGICPDVGKGVDAGTEGGLDAGGGQEEGMNPKGKSHHAGHSKKNQLCVDQKGEFTEQVLGGGSQQNNVPTGYSGKRRV